MYTHVRTRTYKRTYTHAQVAIAPTGFPADALAGLRLVLTPEGVGAESDEDEAALERRLQLLLQRAVQLELEALGTKASEDSALLAVKGASAPSGRLRLAIQFRLEKKQILLQCLKALDA